ncbi:MAG: hypothetical protein U0Y68_09350 [Blastocatellia bacterium]
MKLRFRRSPFVLLLLALVGVALATQRIWHAPQAAKTLPAPPTLRHNTTKATSLAPPRTAAMRNDNDALSGGICAAIRAAGRRQDKRRRHE